MGRKSLGLTGKARKGCGKGGKLELSEDYVQIQELKEPDTEQGGGHEINKRQECSWKHSTGQAWAEGMDCTESQVGKEGRKKTLPLAPSSSVSRRRQWHPTPVLLPGKSHGRRGLVGCSPWGPKESDTTEQLHFQFSLSFIGKGNGNPLQCSCLENPRDWGAWWAAVYGVAQSQTRLKQLSSSSSSSSVSWSDSWCFSLMQNRWVPVLTLPPPIPLPHFLNNHPISNYLGENCSKSTAFI